MSASNFGENGYLIDGISHLYGEKPITRIDGSPLVAGDRWYETATGDDCFWSGTDWVSQSSYETGQIVFNNVNTNTTLQNLDVTSRENPFLFTHLLLNTRRVSGTPFDSVNHIRFVFGIGDEFEFTNTNLISLSLVDGSPTVSSIPIGIKASFPVGRPRRVFCSITRIGSPGRLGGGASLEYRRIR